MKHLRACKKLKLAQLETAQLKEIIEEEEAQNELKQRIWQEENELKQRIRQKENELKQKIRQKEAHRKLELVNAQYEIWMDSDVKAQCELCDLEVKAHDPLGSLQLKKQLSLQAKPFSLAISHAFPSSSSQIIKSGAECKADIIRAPCKVLINTLSVYNSTTRRKQKDKDELGECYFGQPLRSEAQMIVSSAQFPSTPPRDNVTMISEAQSEVKRGSIYKVPGSQSAPLLQSGQVSFASETISNLRNYRSAGVGQYYFLDEMVDKPCPKNGSNLFIISLCSEI